MVDPFPVAIVGAGLMGTWHARYARQSGGFVCGIVDPDRQAAERLAAEFSGVRAFPALGALLEGCRPRAIHICTPLESHYGLAATALNAGVHVLMEKPLAATAVATRDLLLMAQRNGVLLVPAHQFLFQRGFVDAQAALPALGPILHVDATFCSAGAEHVAGTSDEIAFGILPHPLALLERFISGSLALLRWRADRAGVGEWRIVGVTEGVTVSILISLRGRPTECSLRLVTVGGSVELDLFHGFATIDTARISKSGKVAKPFRVSARRAVGAGWNLMQRFATREFAFPGLRALISTFYAAARTGSAPPINADEIIAVAAARDTLLASVAHRAETNFRG